MQHSIRIKLSPAPRKLPTGTSKFLGNPDVWDGFKWPYYEEKGQIYDLTFMCQINCAEASRFDRNHLLPKKGMLYFFYDLDNTPQMCDEFNRMCRVIYYDGHKPLTEMRFVDDDGNDVAFHEQKVSFSRVPAGFLSETDETHLLLGVPSLEYDARSVGIENWQMLLQIDSMVTDDAEINFFEGTLCFFIEPQKLKARDFSTIRAIQTDGF